MNPVFVSKSLIAILFSSNFFAFSRETNGAKVTDPIAADGGEDVEVAGIDEVENDGVEGTLAFLESVGDSVISLLRQRQRTHHWLAPKYKLCHLRAPPTRLRY